MAISAFQVFVVFQRAYRPAGMSIEFVLQFLVVGSALRFSEAEEPLDALVGIFEHAPVGLQEPDVTQKAANAIMQQLARQQARASPLGGAVLDPDLHYASSSCDRDYSQQCPLFFSPAGVGKCAPASDYMGPCASGAQGFDTLSPSAKERWSELCLAPWPCVECRREFSSLCPVGWISDGGTKCKPTATYFGPCGAVVNFGGFTRDMMSEWSSICAAYWPCVE